MAIKQYFAVLAGGAMLSALLLVTIGVIGNRHAGPSALFSIGEPLSAEEEYMTLHPVYTRCAKKADIAAFTKEILVKCGDVNELTYCSWTCTQALQTYSDSVGCCWESVLQGYEVLDGNAGQAWRNWQGTASGKCGVTFAEESCGDSVGEHAYHQLESSVKQLSTQADQNAQIVNALEGAMFGYGYGAYKQTKGSTSMAQPTAKIGGITVDETFDFPNEGKHITNGDISVPVDKVEPPLYMARRTSSAAAFPPAEADAKPAAAARKGRETQLYNAYDDFRNYQNSLRLKSGYDARFKGLKEQGVRPSPIDGRLGGFPLPGESWQD